MNQLKKYLRKLPKQDYEDAIEYFEEYFGETDPAGEQKLMQELGTPKEAARELIANLLDRKIDEQKDSRPSPASHRGTLRIAFLAICAAPVAIPLLVALFAVLLALAICLLSIYFCVFVLAFSVFVVGIKFLIRGILAFPVSVSGSFVILGAGILCIGLGILLSVLGIYLCRWTGSLFVKTAQALVRKKG